MLEVQQTLAGGWLVATVPGRLLLVEESATVSADEVRELWEDISGADGIQRSLDRLTRRGLLATPPFALVEWAGDLETGPFDVRCIVRGEAKISLDTTAGDRDLAAVGVSTWLEQSVSGVTAFRVECGSRATDETAAFLPFVAGASWVSSVRFGFSAAVEADATVVLPARAAAPRAVPDPAPEPVAEPVGEHTLVEETVVEPLDEAEATSVSHVDETSGYDHLFGATMMRSVEDAAVRVDEEPEADDIPQQSQKIDLPAFITGSNPAEADSGIAASFGSGSGSDSGFEMDSNPVLATGSGDHDGMTVFSGDLKKLRGEHTGGQDATVAAKAPEFFLELPDGAREFLGQPVLIGRAPSVSKVSGGRMPRLVTVGSADQDISRNHVQFQVEGDTVVVTDLHSRNGTMIVLPGKAPQKLRQGEPTSLIAGTVVDLGGGVTMTVREE